MSGMDGRETIHERDGRGARHEEMDGEGGET